MIGKTVVGLLVVATAWFYVKWTDIPFAKDGTGGFRKTAKTHQPIEWTESGGISRRSYAVHAIRGRREYMEDRYTIMDNDKTGEDALGTFAVYDGHGGSFFSNFAEAHLLPNVWNRIMKASPDALNVTQVLIEEILNLDQEGTTVGGKKAYQCGSTAVVGVYHKKKLYFANVGDSRAVARRIAGGIFYTRDHKPNDPKELARVKAAGGVVKFRGVWRLGGQLAVSRALGDASLKKSNPLIAFPDVYTIDLKRNAIDFVILASDGLWDVFDSMEAIGFVEKQLKMHRLGARELVEEAFKRGSADNICVIVMKLSKNEISN